MSLWLITFFQAREAVILDFCLEKCVKLNLVLVSISIYLIKNMSFLFSYWSVRALFIFLYWLYVLQVSSSTMELVFSISIKCFWFRAFSFQCHPSFNFFCFINGKYFLFKKCFTTTSSEIHQLNFTKFLKILFLQLNSWFM